MAGWLVNQIYFWLAIDILDWASPEGHNSDSLVYLLSAIVLIVLLIWSYWPKAKSSGVFSEAKKWPGGG
jgi:hypothetical protein